MNFIPIFVVIEAALIGSLFGLAALFAAVALGAVIAVTVLTD